MELRAVSGCRAEERAETPPIDLEGYIGRCHHSFRVEGIEPYFEGCYCPNGGCIVASH